MFGLWLKDWKTGRRLKGQKDNQDEPLYCWTYTMTGLESLPKVVTRGGRARYTWATCLLTHSPIYLPTYPLTHQISYKNEFSKLGIQGSLSYVTFNLWSACHKFLILTLISHKLLPSEMYVFQTHMIQNIAFWIVRNWVKHSMSLKVSLKFVTPILGVCVKTSLM